MTFLVKALRLNKQQMVDAIMSTKFTPTNIPKFALMHNTGVPNMEQWEKYSEEQKINWGDNLNSYYRNDLGWSSGPHACGTPEEWSYQLCDFNNYGIHASCFNHLPGGYSWGVETVGNFCDGGDDSTSILGKKAIDSTINILGAMHLHRGWNPADYEYGVKGLHFHLECKRDGHPCPGNKIRKADIIERIQLRMTEIKNSQNPVNINTDSKIVVTDNTSTTISNTTSTTISNTTDAVTIEAWPAESEYPKFFANMKIFYDTILDLAKDWDNRNYVAAGITANAEAESSFELVEGDKDTGGAFGYCQWHEIRASTILENCQIDIKSASAADQAKAVWWELNNEADLKPALEALKVAANSADAGRGFCKFFEMAGKENAEARRALMARRIAVHFSTN